MDESVIGFIGFGLIGGSIARSLKEREDAPKLIAYNYQKGNLTSGLRQALDDRVLDAVTEDLNDFSECGVIFLCAPVLKNIEYLEKLKPVISERCVLTDVGSVKSNIHEAVERLGLSSQFIGGHPMTGSEKTGYENSYSMLFQNAYYILTPCAGTPKEVTESMYRLVASFGSLPIVLDFREHDDITAAISHLPHIIAAQLVNLIRHSDDPEEKMKLLAAGGFKDITRIASSSPVMWQNICLTNIESIRKFLNRYIESLREADQALAGGDGDALYRMFEEAGTYRDAIPNTKAGAIHKVYEIYLDIIDEAGAIATVATLLATNHVSIKNIGIIHNREFEEGVLRIEFYEAEAKDLAKSLLNRYRYTVYDR